MYSLTFYKGSGIEHKDTFADWFLVPASRPVVLPPSVKTAMIDIPGSNGQIDLTETLNGYVNYGPRSGSWNFYVLNDRTPEISWFDLYSEILNFLHGQRVKVYFNEENDYYYLGRVSVNEWASDPSYSRITLSYSLDPYKYYKNFTRNNVIVSGETSYNLNMAFDMPVVPTIEVENNTGNVSITFEGKQYEVGEGTHKIPSIVLKKGNNLFGFNGSATVQITYQGGKL